MCLGNIYVVLIQLKTKLGNEGILRAKPEQRIPKHAYASGAQMKSPPIFSSFLNL